MKHFITLGLGAVFGFLSVHSKSNDMFSAVVYCPSVYEVIAPNDSLFFQSSYESLETLLTIEAASNGKPLNYYIESSIGEVDGISVKTLPDLVSAISRKIRHELQTGELETSELEAFMGVCPLFWE